MARKKDISERKNQFIGIRLTSEEYNRILSDMEYYGYLSVSKYIRERVLKRKLVIKEPVVTELDIKNQINRLSTQISSIGSNYNMTVKKYLTFCNAKRDDGTPLINTRSTNYYINNLINMTEKVKELMEIVLDTISHKSNCQ